MDETGDWDIESYRSFYESDEHWALKREFMETHYDALPEERLVCLSQVYANIELLGCRYPDKVMEEVSYLARGIGMKYKEQKKTKLQRTFVKASDAAGAKVRASKGQKRKNPDERASHEPSSKKMVFVRSESVPDDALSTKMIPFAKNENAPGNPASNQIMSFIKAVRDDNPDDENEEKKTSDSDAGEPVTADRCMSFIKSLRGEGERSEDTSVGSAVPDQSEKVQKYKKAVQPSIRQKITFPQEENDNSVGRGIGRGNFRSPRGRSTSVGGHSKDRGKYSAHLEALKRSKDPLCGFILVQRVYANNFNPANILYDSSCFSRMPLEIEYDQHETCHIWINGIQVASALSDSRKASKEAASVKALEVLIERCFTLRILKIHSSAEEVSLSEVSSASTLPKQGSSLDTPLEDSSIGSKLLKMMGWAGGGLGKDGSGISEPIKPANVFGRTGLGHKGEQGVTKAFHKKISAMLRDYLNGNGTEDLVFSPLFSKEQRAEIHKKANHMNLKSHSHGKGENRFLVISRKFSPKQLLYQLLQEGSTDKYELVPPGES